MNSAAQQQQAVTPRDCVVMFQMPELPPELQQVVCKSGAMMKIQEHVWYRTPPVSFPEASKRAAHYLAAASQAVVGPAIPQILDAYPEIPLTVEMSDYMYSRRTPRVSIVAQIRENQSWN